MTKCELIDLTPSDSGSDSDFIQVTSHFCIHTASVSVSSFCTSSQVPPQRKLFYRTCACSSNAL